ncbi:MAG: hypothetical protein AAF432_05465 [Planctomycetota bacterium]
MAHATHQRRPRHRRGYTLLESLMAAGILLGIVVAITSAITAGQQHALEAHMRIAGALAAEDLLSRMTAVSYDDILAWNGYTESAGTMTDVHGQSMPDMFNNIGRSVAVSTDLKNFAELGVKVRGRTIRVHSFDRQNRTLSEIYHFVPEPADNAGPTGGGARTAVDPDDAGALHT